MKDETPKEPRYKTIAQVIKELKTFEDQELIVMVSNDEGKTFQPVQLLGKGFEGKNTYCTLFI